jgi:hypothetical protein
MTQRKINSRDIYFQISDGAASPTYLDLENMASFTFNPGENEEIVDTSDFDSDGAYEQEIMQRGASIAAEGMAKQDHLTGALQPGRARVEAMAGETALGADSLAQIRFRYPADTNWRVWNCTVTLGEQGGGSNDKLSWSATFTKSGRTTLVAVS